MEHWYGRRPVIFENRDLDLAVAVGAAYYSYVRATGAGLLVRGGLPRAYFIGLGGGDRSAANPVSGSARRRRRIDGRARSGKSATGDQQAGVVPPVQLAHADRGSARRDRRVSANTDDGELHLHAPLNAVLRFGKAGERLVPVKLGARLTEVGTLEIWADSKESEHRWRLQFELRKSDRQAGCKPRRVPRR